MTAMLRVDGIPIHPARTYPPGEDHRMCLPGWSVPLIETAKLVDPTVAGSDQRHQGCRAGAPPISLRRTVLT